MPITSPRASANLYSVAPLYGKEPLRSRQIAEVVNGIMGGKINSTGSVSLATSGTTTTLTNAYINPNSVILLMATNALAGGELGMWITPADGTATINHGVNASARTFNYVVLG